MPGGTVWEQSREAMVLWYSRVTEALPWGEFDDHWQDGSSLVGSAHSVPMPALSS